jgi:hypothetical protein
VSSEFDQIRKWLEMPNGNNHDNNNDLLFKYKNLEGGGFKHFVDIILNNRLYASDWKDLNDPMEGLFYYWDLELMRDIKRRLECEKMKVRVCCLSSDCNNSLMWGHYARGNKGVVIGVEVKEGQKITEIEYDGSPFFETEEKMKRASAEDILSHKNKEWEYEKERRVFIRKTDEEFSYIGVNVKQVILGNAMGKSEKEFIRGLVERLCPCIEISNQPGTAIERE